jgi:hypothetical protein
MTALVKWISRQLSVSCQSVPRTYKILLSALIRSSLVTMADTRIISVISSDSSLPSLQESAKNNIETRFSIFIKLTIYCMNIIVIVLHTNYRLYATYFFHLYHCCSSEKVKINIYKFIN